MEPIGAGRGARRVFAAMVAVAAVASVCAAGGAAADDSGGALAGGGAETDGRWPATAVVTAPPQALSPPALMPVTPVPDVPAPSDVVREVGSWFAHGTTLELLPDGNGTFATWVGAFDGNRISLRLIPAPGEATVAEVVAVETVGQGALAPEALPGMGGLFTIAFGIDVRTAHVEWTAGPDRHAVDLCPAQGLDAAMMEALSCGA